MKIRAKLLIDIETEVNDNISNKETLRYMVEDDLSESKLNYTVYSCELKTIFHNKSYFK